MRSVPHRNALRVVTYHRIAHRGESPHLDPRLLSATPEGFERQMRLLGRRHRVVSLSQVVAASDGGPSLPPRAVLVTFDDGYADLASHAIPALRRLGMPATIFVPTAFPDRPEKSFRADRLHRAFASASCDEIETPAGRLLLRTPQERIASHRWLVDHLKRVPHGDAERMADQVCERLGSRPAVSKTVLGWAELREVARHGIEIAAHSRSHAILTGLRDDDLSAELAGARDDLAREIGSTLPVLCYPAGRHDERVVTAAREHGYRLGFTTLDGENDLAVDDLMRLRRTNITTRTTPAVLRWRLTAWGARLDRWRHRRL